MALRIIKLARGSSANPNPTITVTQGGDLRINKAAQDELGLAAGQHLQFLDDPERANTLFLKQADAGEQDTRVLKGDKDGKGTSLTVSATSATRSLKIKPGRYSIQLDEETGLPAFEFVQAEVANENERVSKPRAAKKAS
ncbi:hypothetical protein [Tautonia plasticadhaerens]|uniref:Uncharacterized protein n=1 Tax=Tautonia plasticadhaerens TaxID=2527974 RepID=A0A518H272_9BACT|nr:hypothetical protein [Tautonia plasticadhaerens]QDV34942.1 hypothetical protein ElP_28390 [Tautonia plasticadhaerens]